MVRMQRWTLAAAIAALAVSITAGAALAADNAVTIAGFAFDPATVTIQVGDTVTWTNQDAIAHTATAGDGSFDTGNIGPSTTASATFDTAGTFAYHCSIHRTMTGTVVVEAAAGTPAPTAKPTAAPTIGDAVSITPAPTDTLSAPGAEDGGSLAVTLALATLGLVMLVGTLVADRRFRKQRDEE
jgi:plastocyanin